LVLAKGRDAQIRSSVVEISVWVEWGLVGGEREGGNLVYIMEKNIKKS
jgi:hypothetical protein